MNDTIILDNAKFLVHLGVTDKERKKKQPVFITLTIQKDIRPASENDDIEKTINWEHIHDVLDGVLTSQPWNLVETLAENIASKLLQKFSPEMVRVRVEKPHSLKEKNVHFCAVEIERKP